MGTLVANTPPLVSTRRGYEFTKCLLDVTLCLMMLPFIVLIMALIALAIRLDSPGPILFRQARAGRGGRPFQMLKFRTMPDIVPDERGREFMKAYVRGEIGSEDGESTPQVYKPKLAVTHVGKFLRKTSLDELPQIINVLRGEMSLVGPRPHALWEVEEYLEWHRERLAVLPGITGLAQVRGRSGITFDRLVRYDIEYVRQKNLGFDLKILCRTAISVLWARGAA